MANWVQWYREGGSMMHAVTLMEILGIAFVLLAFTLALVARLTGKAGGAARVGVIIAAIFALAPGCAGIIGYNIGMSRTEDAVANVDPEYRKVILAAGTEEASHNLSYGFSGVCCLLLPVAMAFFLAPSKPVEIDGGYGG